MPNVLVQSLDAMRSRFFTRIWIAVFYLVGYAVLYRVNPMLCLGVWMINAARSVRVT